MTRGLALAVSLALAGCYAGARSYVVAPRAEYPISFTDGIRDPAGDLLVPARRVVVGSFSYHYRAWGAFFTLVSFTGEKDISEEVNRQVREHGGEAIIDFAILPAGCLLNLFTVLFSLGLLPGCSNIELTGTIIRRSLVPDS